MGKLLVGLILLAVAAFVYVKIMAVVKLGFLVFVAAAVLFGSYWWISNRFRSGSTTT